MQKKSTCIIFTVLVICQLCTTVNAQGGFLDPLIKPFAGMFAGFLPAPAKSAEPAKPAQPAAPAVPAMPAAPAIPAMPGGK